MGEKPGIQQSSIRRPYTVHIRLSSQHARTCTRMRIVSMRKEIIFRSCWRGVPAAAAYVLEGELKSSENIERMLIQTFQSNISIRVILNWIRLLAIEEELERYFPNSVSALFALIAWISADNWAGGIRSRLPLTRDKRTHANSHIN